MRTVISIFALLWLVLPGRVNAETPAETDDETPDEARVETLPGGKCLECHLEIEDEASQLWKEDVHAQAGITCDECHGGDSAQEDKALAKGRATGYRGVLSPKDITSVCGDCHSDAEYMKGRNPLLAVDQLEKYWTSQHGKSLQRGEGKVAQCASCHDAHGVRKVNDAKSPVYAANVPAMCARCHADAEYMEEFDLSTDQYDEYVESVHGKALLEKNDVRGAPACNDCHGNHGAAAPTVNDITNICGACHSYNAELFLTSKMASAFREKSLADCIACHDKHYIVHTSDEWVGDDRGTTCAKCHERGDKGAELAWYFADTLREVQRSFEEIDKVLTEAENKGMDIMEGEDHVEEARMALLQTRTLIHSFSKPIVDEKVHEIQLSQEAAMEFGYAALDAFEERRRGLAVSTLLLLLLTIGVAIKIRKLPPLE